MGVPPGLCAACVHHRRIESRRGSEFHLCERSRTDPRFPRYPPLPVWTCAGFERRMEQPGPADTPPDPAPDSHEGPSE